MFEQEVYHNFSISSCRSYFISFTGDVRVQRFVSDGKHLSPVMCLMRVVKITTVFMLNIFNLTVF